MAPLPNRPTAWVSGAGPTGCLAALALGRAGWQVSLHDPASAPTLLIPNPSVQHTNGQTGVWRMQDSKPVCTSVVRGARRLGGPV